MSATCQYYSKGDLGVEIEDYALEAYTVEVGTTSVEFVSIEVNEKEYAPAGNIDFTAEGGLDLLETFLNSLIEGVTFSASDVTDGVLTLSSSNNAFEPTAFNIIEKPSDTAQELSFTASGTEIV